MRRRQNLLPVLAPLVSTALLGLLAQLSACSSNPSADLPNEPAARERAVGELLTLRDPRTGEQDGAGYLEVTIANPSPDRLSTRCAPEWYDAKGTLVAPATDWQSVDLKPAEERRVRFAPMPAAARSWRLRFES
jgi:uncharacterized protein YcfL